MTSSSEREAILDKLLYAMNVVRHCQFDRFRAGLSEDDRQTKKFANVAGLLEKNLSNVSDYIIGFNASFHLITIGITPGGDWMGIVTYFVWT